MEWIKVTDRLPKEELFGGYLVCFVTNTGEQKMCVSTFSYTPQHNFENPPMHPTFYVYPSGGHKINATHWMPLPEPPKND